MFNELLQLKRSNFNQFGSKQDCGETGMRRKGWR